MNSQHSNRKPDVQSTATELSVVRPSFFHNQQRITAVFPFKVAVSMTLIASAFSGSLLAQELTPVRNMGRSQPGFETTPETRVPQTAVPRIQRESPYWIDTDPGNPVTEYGWSEDDVAYVTKRRMLTFDIGGSASAGYTYDDNLFLADSSEGAQGVSSSNLSLMASATYGPNSWGLNSILTYNPMFQWFYDAIETPEGDTVNQAMNHSVTWSTVWTGARLRANLDLTYIAMDGANIEVGQWVTQNTANANLGVAYDYSPKTTFGASFSTQLMDLSGAFLSQNQFGSTFFASYQITPKIQIGPNIGYTYAEVDGGSDTESIQYQLRATWAATAKLTVSMTGGVEDRTFSADDEGTVSPVFMIDANYNPSGDGRTSIGLSGYRRFTPSVALANQGFYATGVTANFNQQLGDRLAFATMAGYEIAEYEAMASDTQSGRSDDILFWRTQLTYALNERFSFTAFYQFSENESTGFGANSFSRNQYGIMATAAF
jgi:hypothetical protein